MFLLCERNRHQCVHFSKRSLLRLIFTRLHETGLFQRIKDSMVKKFKAMKAEAQFQPASFIQVKCLA